MTCGRELYVYYRVRRGDADAAQAQVEAAQARLRTALPGLEARLLRRCEEGAPAEAGRDPTWMEIYRHAAGLDDAACAQIEAVLGDGPAARSGPRITERFEPFDALLGAAAADPLS
jgi:hypothetical protein